MRAAFDWEQLAAVSLLTAAIVVGLSTAPDYGISIDEFNADDYGPKALAWYRSGFTDRSHFETVEAPLWYYGPWLQILIAYVQSLNLGDPFTVRHAITFLVGIAGLAAVVPLGRLAFGQWAGLSALLLCLTTGYLYGSLFFSPIDVPFLATMTWATLSALVMTRQLLPSWNTTLATGVLVGLAVGTRPGGIIVLAYTGAALALCVLEFFAIKGLLTKRYVLQIMSRYAVVGFVGLGTATLIWPWLQIGNPLEQFRITLVHFANLPTAFDFMHWGERVSSNDLPRWYIPGQLLARLPVCFLLLLGVFLARALLAAARLPLEAAVAWRSKQQQYDIRGAILVIARQRGVLLVCLAILMPLGLLIVERTTLYDGVRHVLFLIPLLAVLAGAGLGTALPWLRRVPALSAAIIGGYAADAMLTLARLHPLEYIEMNALAGGTNGAYGRFDLDYWSLAATEAVRRLERRLDYAPPETPARVAICITWREWAVAPLLRRPWIIEVNPQKADYVIETERWPCARELNLNLVDEVKRFDRSFAWTYARQ